MEFRSMGITAPILEAITEMGFQNPTPIQEQAIPILRAGQDMVGQAQTGTGKTAAFGIPAIEYCIKNHRPARKSSQQTANPRVLIMAPTRELAVQISQELTKMSKKTNITNVCVYGGQPIEKQLRQFRDPVDILIGTPGRILDHLQRGTLDLAKVGYVILDEADRMLDMGFIDDVVQILDNTHSSHQTALFSATMPKEIENIAHEYMKDHKVVKVSEDKPTIDKIKQYFIQVTPRNRLGYLLSIITEHKPKLAVVFVRTKMSAKRLADILNMNNVDSDCLHGDMKQGARDKAMQRFKKGKLHVLVATDLAARGLDVFDVSHVINYDLPEDPQTYIHRIGRTGRMGSEGVAISFAFDDQIDWIANLPKTTNSLISEMQIEPAKRVITNKKLSPPNRDTRGGSRSYGRPMRGSDRRDKNTRRSPSHSRRNTRGGHSYHGRGA
jgi:ATP-dependent RNA helicase DeaD